MAVRYREPYPPAPAPASLTAATIKPFNLSRHVLEQGPVPLSGIAKAVERHERDGGRRSFSLNGLVR